MAGTSAGAAFILTAGLRLTHRFIIASTSASATAWAACALHSPQR